MSLSMFSGLGSFAGLADLFTNGAASEAFGVVAAIMAVILLVNCFFGYKLLKIYITIMGFVIGVIAAISLQMVVIVVFGDNSAVNVIALVIGLMSIMLPFLFAFLAFKVYKVGIFIYCGTLPALIGLIFWGKAGALLLFVLFGTLAVLLSRPYIIASTAIPSGLSAGSLILTVFRVDNTGAGILLGAVLAVAGVIVQWKTTGKSSGKQELSHAPQYQMPAPSPGQAAPPTPAGAVPARFCRSCGSRMDSESLFCRNCGAKFDDPRSSQSTV